MLLDLSLTVQQIFSANILTHRGDRTHTSSVSARHATVVVSKSSPTFSCQRKNKTWIVITWPFEDKSWVSNKDITSMCLSTLWPLYYGWRIAFPWNLCRFCCIFWIFFNIAKSHFMYTILSKINIDAGIVRVTSMADATL